MSTPLVIVVALAENGVIGRDGGLPWRLKTDLARFRRVTMGKPMIMGRRSWDAVGRPLPGRRSIVLTRDGDFAAEGAEIVRAWPEALAAAERNATEMGANEIVIFGGAEIYRLALPEADRLRLTRVHARPEGDTRFPAFDSSDFVETFREEHGAGEGDEYAFTYQDLERRRPTASRV